MSDLISSTTIQSSTVGGGGPWTPMATLTDTAQVLTAFTVPALEDTVLASISPTTWFSVGDWVNIVEVGVFEVMGKSGTDVTLKYLDALGNLSAGFDVPPTQQVVPGSYPIPAPIITTWYNIIANAVNGESFTLNVTSIVVSPPNEQPGDLRWVVAPPKSAGSGADRATGVSVDTNGGVFITGDKAGGAFWNKYNASGGVVQENAMSSGSAFPKCAAVDASNNFYFGGYTLLGGNFGGGALPSGGGSDTPFLVKCDNSGNHLWSKSYPHSGGQAMVHGIAVDSINGFVYVSGKFGGNLDYSGTGAGTPLLAAQNNQTGATFVMKINASTGATVWAKSYGEQATLPSQGAIALDRSVNPPYIWITGSFIGDINFGGGVMTSEGTGGLGDLPTEDVYIAKLDHNGDYLFADIFGGSLADYGLSIGCSPVDGRVYLGGRYRNTINFGGADLVGGGAYHDAFLVAFNSAGAWQWQKNIASTQGAFDDVFGITVDSSGNVYACGNFFGTLDFGNSVTVNGSNDVFIVKINSAGAAQWARSFGNYSIDQGLGITVGGGYVYTAGTFYGSVNFGDNLPISSGINSRAFVTKHKA